MRVLGDHPDTCVSADAVGRLDSYLKAILNDFRAKSPYLYLELANTNASMVSKYALSCSDQCVEEFA